MTESGKTTLAKEIAKEYKKQNKPVLVLDPWVSSSWKAEYITDDPVKLNGVIRRSTKCAVFIDECGYWLKEYRKYLYEWATTSRHYGHNTHFIAQTVPQVPPTVRVQCSNLFLFCQGKQYSKDLAAEYGADELMEAHKLKKGEYLYKLGVGYPVKKSKVF